MAELERHLPRHQGHRGSGAHQHREAVGEGRLPQAVAGVRGALRGSRDAHLKKKRKIWPCPKLSKLGLLENLPEKYVNNAQNPWVDHGLIVISTMKMARHGERHHF